MGTLKTPRVYVGNLKIPSVSEWTLKNSSECEGRLNIK